jgi:hypothetical protein
MVLTNRYHQRFPTSKEGLQETTTTVDPDQRDRLEARTTSTKAVLRATTGPLKPHINTRIPLTTLALHLATLTATTVAIMIPTITIETPMATQVIQHKNNDTTISAMEASLQL